MKILAIETSCDETALAVLEAKGSLTNPSFKVLAEVLYSQAKLHAEFGGVFPTLAKREHIKNLPILLKKIEKKIDLKKIDFLAVTTGPGLEPALWTGIVLAKELAEKFSLPLIPVNHMEGHIFSVITAKDKITYPALALLISGGHTELVFSKEPLKYKILGKTRDDAVGEAFDKVARILGLSYPGGPEISKQALKFRSLKKDGSIKLPRPMIHSKDLDFSFSGLKTAVLYLTQKIGNLTDEIKMEIAKEFEDSVTEVLVSKTRKALEENQEKIQTKTLIVAGGVSANKHIRKEILKLKKEFKDLQILFPSKKLTGDNAVMIGRAGYMRVVSGKFKVEWKYKIKAQGNLSL